MEILHGSAGASLRAAGSLLAPAGPRHISMQTAVVVSRLLLIKDGNKDPCAGDECTQMPSHNLSGGGAVALQFRRGGVVSQGWCCFFTVVSTAVGWLTISRRLVVSWLGYFTY